MLFRPYATAPWKILALTLLFILLRCLVVLTLGLAMKAVLAAPRVGRRETAKSADRVSLPVPER
jgi:hypothetical protein